LNGLLENNKKSISVSRSRKLTDVSVSFEDFPSAKNAKPPISSVLYFVLLASSILTISLH
jgi:hypothetical protein